MVCLYMNPEILCLLLREVCVSQLVNVLNKNNITSFTFRIKHIEATNNFKFCFK